VLAQILTRQTTIKGGDFLKGFLNFLDVICNIILVLWQAVEVLTIPALFVIIGICNDFSWQYYVISIGGYFLLLALLDTIFHFVFKALEKKYTPIFERIINNFAERIFK